MKTARLFGTKAIIVVPSPLRMKVAEKKRIREFYNATFQNAIPFSQIYYHIIIKNVSSGVHTRGSFSKDKNMCMDLFFYDTLILV